MRSPDSISESITEGASPLLTLAEAQEWVGLPPDAGSPAGLDLIIAAVQELVDGPESETGYSYRQRSVSATIRGLWPSSSDPVLLPPPVDPATLSVDYTRSTGGDGDLAPSMIDHYREDGRDYVLLGNPGDHDGRSLTIGYRTADASMPAPLKVAMRALLAWMWQERTMWLNSAFVPRDNPAIQRILSRYRVSRMVV